MRRWLRFGAALFFCMLLPMEARAAEYLIPVGRIVGLQLHGDSMTVVAYDDLLGGCARDAGIKIGDELLEIDGVAVSSVEEVRGALEKGGDSVELTVRRNHQCSRVSLTPAVTEEGPRLGVYLRQGISGVGTVTYYDPQTGIFGTLGHGVSDAKGKLLTMTRGSAYEAAVVTVKKGKSGDPGQLKGAAESDTTCGTLLRNTPQGVFGRASRGWEGEALPVADYGEITTGQAQIRSTVSGGEPQEYSVEILKIYPQDRTDGRNFLIRVTDPKLLETTGGIVQGMSGSPICQNGKIVGAVTHVLVNDPTMGYGIFIENMLDAAG